MSVAYGFFTNSMTRHLRNREINLGNAFTFFWNHVSTPWAVRETCKILLSTSRYYLLSTSFCIAILMVSFMMSMGTTSIRSAGSLIIGELLIGETLTSLTIPSK